MAIIYALSNPAMPGLVKIGKIAKSNRTIENRMKELYSTGVPLPFELVRAARVNESDIADVERKIHEALDTPLPTDDDESVRTRVNPKREFFQVEKRQVSAIFDLLVRMGAENVVQHGSRLEEEELEAAQEFKNRQRRPNMNLLEMGIDKGQSLVFKDDDTKTAEVLSRNKVLYDGQEMSLTAATQRILDDERPLRPAVYWLYQNKLLSQIYDETY